MLVSSWIDDAAAPPPRRWPGLVVVWSATCRCAAPGWSDHDTPLAAVLILLYGTIRDARKWLARRRKNEERTAGNFQRKISLRTEKKAARRRAQNRRSRRDEGLGMSRMSCEEWFARLRRSISGATRPRVVGELPRVVSTGEGVRTW